LASVGQREHPARQAATLASTAPDPGFWNLRAAVDTILAAGSQYAGGYDSHPFELLDTDRLPDLPESLPSPPSDSPAAPPDAEASPEPEIVTIAYDWDEVIEILEEHHPVLAQFWATRGRIARAPVSGRTRTDGGTTVGVGSGSSYADSSKASSPDGVDVYDSRAYESVWVQVPDDWGSWRVALLIMDVASGRARSESTSDLAGQFDRFIEARLGRQRVRYVIGPQVPPCLNLVAKPLLHCWRTEDFTKHRVRRHK
jgi:hypothetical protein